jgi:DNA invertase Pin-like site-specific DNA recombinase
LIFLEEKGMMKRYVAWVCTRTKGGRAAEAQEEALHRFASRRQGVIVRLWRTTTSPTSCECHLAREQMVAYVRQNASNLDGILFYRLDRAARTFGELRELVRLEVEQGVRLIFVAEPYENLPAARLERRFLTGMFEVAPLGGSRRSRKEKPAENPPSAESTSN